jgi:hypothetical protein
MVFRESNSTTSLGLRFSATALTNRVIRFPVAVLDSLTPNPRI